MDWIGFSILGAYFVILILIGLLCSGKQKSLQDYFLAHRNIPAWAALAAVVATETSAVTFTGAPTYSFKEGGDFSFLQMAFGFVLARFILSFYFLPRFFERTLVTIYQFLGHQFGLNTQKTAGIFFFVTRALAAGVRHYAAALVFSSITGFDITWAIFLTGFISLIYSITGGLNAVIWTEVFQFVIMVAGSLLAFGYLLYLVPGGMTEILRIGSEHGKFSVIHWEWSGTGSYTFFLGMLNGICLSLATHGADQDLMQRLLSCRSMKDAQIAMIGSGIFVFFQFMLFLFIGVMLFVFYNGALPSGVEKPDQLLPYFVAHHLPSAAGAIVIAAILSAALSSTASALNSLASSTMTDWVMPHLPETTGSARVVFLSRMFTLGWTVLLMIIAVLTQNSESIFQTAFTVPGFTYGSLLAAFLLGIFTPIRNERAVISGMLLGVVAVVVLYFLGFQHSWYVPAGALTAMGAAWGMEKVSTK